jgi:hypothetical protein
MAKAGAQSNDSEPEVTGPRVIAEWVGSDKSPRIDKRSARVISKKDMKDNVLMEIKSDYAWGPATAYRQDVTEESEAFQEWLKASKEFKVTEEG